MRICALIIAAAVLGSVAGCRKAGGENTIYDSDPNHLWNHLNETLFERTAQDGKRYGLDELDVLYWPFTKNLLTEPSHDRAMAALDEFIQSHGEKEIQEPLKRAWLQRDLWTLFDKLTEWTNYAPQRVELENRLAVVIRRLALTTNEIAALPDNYALTSRWQAPDLPRGLFETNGDWVSLSPDAGGRTEIAPLHDRFFGGHSAFLVMVHLPQGREAARDYLNQVRFQTIDHSPQEVLSAILPQFPTNTEWALARRLVLIDANGNLQPTRVTESIQMRRYFSLSKPHFIAVTNNGTVRADEIPRQKFFEFRMDRRGDGGLRELAPDEKDFFFGPFLTGGPDPFEPRRNDQRVASDFRGIPLQSCPECHSSTGIYSVPSFTGQFSPHDAREAGQLYETDPNREMMTAIDWKRQQFDWGLLQGLWRRDN
jgi:hypothetical protein